MIRKGYAKHSLEFNFRILFYTFQTGFVVRQFFHLESQLNQHRFLYNEFLRHQQSALEIYIDLSVKFHEVADWKL